MYPEVFYSSEKQRALAKRNRLLYKPSHPTVIAVPQLGGWAGRGERTGYRAQKPSAVFDPLVRMTCKPGDLVIDVTAGSGTTGIVAARHGCRVILSDRDPKAIRIMEKRLKASALQFALPTKTPSRQKDRLGVLA